MERAFFIGMGITVAWLAPSVVWAQPAGASPLLTRPLGLVLALALVAILPFAFMALTAFLKISTVLQIVRGAIGAQNIPSGTVIMALAGVLSLVAMAPVGSRIASQVEPLLEKGERQTTSELATGISSAVKDPMQAFLAANASKRELRRFLELGRAARPKAERDAVKPTDLLVVMPAFMVTELMEAFALGFAIYLPFLIIDLVVSNVLLALGMQMMSPTQVSLPFKLLLFVAVDGWGLLAQSLVTGYAPG